MPTSLDLEASGIKHHAMKACTVVRLITILGLLWKKWVLCNEKNHLLSATSRKPHSDVVRGCIGALDTVLVLGYHCHTCLRCFPFPTHQTQINGSLTCVGLYEWQVNEWSIHLHEGGDLRFCGGCISEQKHVWFLGKQKLLPLSGIYMYFFISLGSQ